MIVIKPHTTISREVLDSDFDRVKKDAAEMLDIIQFLIREKIWKDIAALAHSQITDTDPLRFFVLRDSIAEELGWEYSPIVLNPVFIPDPYGSLKTMHEQCVTFSHFAPVETKRYYSGTLRFLNNRGIQERKVKGKLAQICQHECDHFDGKYIYPIT